jgi:cytoskeleton protein RodZ
VDNKTVVRESEAEKPADKTPIKKKLPKAAQPVSATPELNSSENKIKPQKPEAKPKPEAKKIIKPNNKAQEIIVEALDKVQFYIYNKNGKKEIQLKPDQVYTIKTKGQVRLEFTDGGAINLIHNGADLGVPGDLGKPLKLTLPKK